MSNKKKNSLYYRRESLIGMGPSQIEVFEVETPGQNLTFNIGKNVVRIKTVNVEGMSNLIKPYIFIEKYESLDLTTIDILYGNLDISAIKKDSDLRKKLFETILTRENLELITRKYCGLIPASITTDPYGRAHYDYDRQSMMLLAKSVFSTAYLENRQTTIQMNNSERSGFSKSSTKKGKGLFDRIFGTSDKSKKDENQNQLGTYNNMTTYTKNEGVLFYRSGVVIFNKSKFLKFNYATKDTETGIQTEVNNFLISDFDEDRLRWDDEYRKNFVKEVLTPSRLKNNRGVPLFPFIGEFTDSGHFQNNIDVWVAFNEITEGYRQ